ncbi:MAG TPA: hypothetical protein VGA40_00770 [Candidatus Acidoferrales bacterium]
MTLTRQQLADRASLTADRVLAAITDQMCVERFIDAYVAAHNRRELRESPIRYRELTTLLTREALLAMTGAVNAALPFHLTRRRPPLLREAEAAQADLFREIYFTRLRERLDWSAADLEEFRDDLRLFAHLAPAPERGRKRNAPPRGPFVDRCAFLLDPSLLDKARAAAARFQEELEEVASAALKTAFAARGRRR